MTASAFTNEALAIARRQGYEPNECWARLPTGYRWSEVAAVAVDSHDRVFVFNRGEHPVMIFDSDGAFLSSWGEGVFVRPHGVTIGPDDAVYCTDDGDHTVRKFTPEGRLLMTLGTSGQPSQTGVQPVVYDFPFAPQLRTTAPLPNRGPATVDFRTIRQSGPPFHSPTNVAIGTDGEIYVTDGYGNARVHCFAPDGRRLSSWGQPGTGFGQFRVPHGIAFDCNNHVNYVYVADRENDRIQVFWPDGEFINDWPGLARPNQVVLDADANLWVVELGYRAGMWPGITAPPGATGGRVSVFDAQDKLIMQFGGGNDPTAPGDFFAPHDLCVDSRGNFYVAEVVMSAGGNRGLVSPECHTLQKFVRVAAARG